MSKTETIIFIFAAVLASILVAGQVGLTGSAVGVCTDNDGGEAPNLRGMARKASMVGEDYCFNDKEVIEYACAENKMVANGILCSEDRTCRDGACLLPADCTDTDNGADYFTRGTMSSPTGAFTDKCATPTVLYEYSCNNPDGTYHVYDCALRGQMCVDGVCV